MPSLGLFQRKQVWFPTLRGWLLIIGAATLLGVGAIAWTVPFLAADQPLHRGILVVEGWLPDYALAEARKTFEQYPYTLLVVTGVPIDQGFHISQEKNYAQLAASTLRQLGMKEASIVPVACPNAPRDRTYSTARKVRVWLDQRPATEPVDVLTLGVHARRTWLLYRLALGQKYPTGIIAAADQRYDADHWWQTSSGFRTVTSEIIAYLYAKLLFYPRQTQASD